MPSLPFHDVDELDDRLSEPTPAVVEMFGRLRGDLICLGAGGKMGLSLAVMARRACEGAGSGARVIAVSRFSNREQRERIERRGVETLSCNLLDPEQVAALPHADNVVFLAGTKFGTTGQEARTWATNSFLPGLVCHRFRDSRIVAFSTGNVYGLTPVSGGGSREEDAPDPVGEYAMSCLGRERIFEYFSRESSIPTVLIRLNYSTELRYGVLVDIAQQVHRGDVLDVSMGHFNVIWQRDACAMSLLALEHAASPPLILNVTGPETLRVRDVADRFGALLNREVRLTGSEAPTALLSNASRACKLFGPPTVSTAEMIPWVAEWIGSNRPTSGKPTHFSSREGDF